MNMCSGTFCGLFLSFYFLVKKWIYSDTERSPLHRQSAVRRRGQVQPRNLVWLAFIGWLISCANEWEGYSNYFWEGAEISREKAMAPHSSSLAWEIPWMEEPGRLQSMGLLRVGQD